MIFNISCRCFCHINCANKEGKDTAGLIIKRKLKYNDYFIVKNEQKSYCKKEGYRVYNRNNEEIDIIFMCDTARTPAFGNCELCVYNEHKQYGEWHRIKSHGSRIKWEHLCKVLKEQEEYQLFID